jgi:pSer/pThr/pTyr-binding forkhead associated (FHA) protein
MSAEQSSPSDETLNLEFITGSRMGEKVGLLADKDQILGRGSDADILIDHKKASRRHARIFARASSHFIEDLGSINGTIVNGEKIKEKELYPGDSIQIADARFRVRSGNEELGINEDQGLNPATVGIFRDRDPAGEFATMGSSMSGSLATTKPKELLGMMSEANATGVLSVHASWGTGRILFRKGAIYYARVDGSPSITPEKAIQRLIRAKSGSFEFNHEPPLKVDSELSISMEAILEEHESFPVEFAKLDKLIPSPDAGLIPAKSVDENSLSDDQASIFRLARKNGAIPHVLDHFPGRDTDAVRAIIELIKKGTLSCQRSR